MIHKIQIWKNEDKFYINTRPSTHVLCCIIQHQCVSVIGPPGCGKTALIIHVALEMEKKGYTIISVTKPKEIFSRYNSNRKTLFIADDVCVRYSAIFNSLCAWRKYMTPINIILENSKCKLIVACRLQDFQDEDFSNLTIFNECICNLGTEDLSLRRHEKEKMIVHYFGEYASEAMKEIQNYECLPLLCKFFKSQNIKTRFDLKIFFRNSFSFYETELTHMYNKCKDGKFKYCALLILVIFNNKLEVKDLQGKNDINTEFIKNTKDVCEIHCNLTGRHLLSQLVTLTGTFVSYDKGCYHSINNKFFDCLSHHFGTHTKFRDILLLHARAPFLQERCVLTNETGHSEYSNYEIIIPDDKLQMYIERIFMDMIFSLNVEQYVRGNTNFHNVKFHIKLFYHMKCLCQSKIENIIETSSYEFLNKIFAMRDNVTTEGHGCYTCQYYAIVIPDNMLEQYIEKWFQYLTKTYLVNSFMHECRSLMDVRFRAALRKHMGKMNTKTVIDAGSKDFINTMFVMTKDDIKDYSKKRDKCFGIVIPDVLLHHYIERWFQHMTKSHQMKEFIERSRPFKNVTFRIALQTYMRKLPTEAIRSLISYGTDDFINVMFVITEDDIKDNTKYSYECLGIVITGDLLQHYIDRWFELLTRSNKTKEFIERSRPLLNVKFRNALRSFVRKLSTVRICSLINNGSVDFISTMFVMTKDDIEDNAENQYKCLGIVIPDNLLQQYVERWFNHLNRSNQINEFMENSRPMIDFRFRIVLRSYLSQLTKTEIEYLIFSGTDNFINTMFVISEDDVNDYGKYRYECLDIVIPEDLIQYYIERWFERLSRSDEIKEFIKSSRLLLNDIFCTCLRIYIRQLSRETICTLIQTGSDDFINTMFVMTSIDIKDNTDNQYDCLGIVIPEDLLQHYIDRMFEHFTNSSQIKEFVESCRPLLNVEFNSTLLTYMKQLSKEEICSIINNSSDHFISTMFCMTEDDLKANAENQNECIGIVIPVDLVQHYIKRWFECLAKSNQVKEFFESSRTLMNVTFSIAVHTYMINLDPEVIRFLIYTGTDDFINTMFVISKDDINGKYRYECLGIVIPEYLLKHYIERWFERLTRSNEIKKFINSSRPLMNVAFTIPLCDYMRQMNLENILYLIHTGSEDFICTMFVITTDDIKDNTENRYECLGIVIPDNFLHLYIKRCFKLLYRCYSTEKFIGSCRPLLSVTFRKALNLHIRQLDSEQIRYLIQTGNENFISTMFVMTEDNIKNNAERRYECLGIVIPDHLLNFYIERWFERLTRSSQVKQFIESSRPLLNVKFRTAMRSYMRQLSIENIRSLIHAGSDDFANTMFVKTQNEIKYNGKNRYECLGIVIPDELVEYYIKRWFNDMTHTNSVKNFIDSNRCIMSLKFRKNIESYIHKLNSDQIRNLIRTGSRDFVNTVFIFTRNDITSKSENRQDWFGILIPDDMLHHYIKRLIYGKTKADSTKHYIDESRIFTNSKFQATLKSYLDGNTSDKIAFLDREGHNDCLNTCKNYVKHKETCKINS